MSRKKVCIEEIENGYVVTLYNDSENSFCQKHFQLTLNKTISSVKGFLILDNRADCNYITCDYDKEEVQRILDESILPIKAAKEEEKLKEQVSDREKIQEEFESALKQRTRCHLCIEKKDDIKERINESTMMKQKYPPMCDECWEKTLVSIGHDELLKDLNKEDKKLPTSYDHLIEATTDSTGENK